MCCYFVRFVSAVVVVAVVVVASLDLRGENETRRILCVVAVAVVKSHHSLFHSFSACD